MSLIIKARTFCIAAHEAIQQKRKYTGEPYWKHPQAVARIVGSVICATEDMIAAAFLHDCVEDTGVTLEIVEDIFGRTVASYVNGLTDKSKPEDGNRAVRKKIDRNWIAQQCHQVKTIKLADLIHNSESILKYDRDFARVYLPEKELLLEVLKEGDSKLWNQAKRIVDEAKLELGM